MSGNGEGGAGQERSGLQQFEAMEKRINEHEAKLRAKQDNFRAKQDELKKEMESELDEFRAKQDELKKEMESELDEFHKSLIDSMLSSEPEPEPPSAGPPAAELFDGLVDLKEFEKFAKHPYFMYPGRKRDTMYVVVPKFYPSFQVGWLLDEIDGVWNRYEVNQYAVLFGSVPEEISRHLKLPTPIPVTVEGSKITFDPEDKKEVRRRLPAHVTDWTENSARITRDNEFKIIDRILQSGRVPFKPHPVREEHTVSGLDDIRFRPYQQEAWDNFLRTGAVGIFHPTGSGKSFLGMAALARVRVGNRRNLVIAPTRTLVDQWLAYLSEHAPDVLKKTLVMTYQGFKHAGEQFGITIYDECRTLPAHTFARLSTIPTEYRMGLDATPYREDGKNHLIVSLTGYPQKLNWQEYMRKWGPGYHAVNVHVVHNSKVKLDRAEKLYDPRRRTMFYSYHIEIGKKMAGRLGLPFISAATDDRLSIMKENRSFVATAVFGEGLHVEDLDDIIEIDFHYGSRREEMQLSGRLMHSKRPNKRHHIIMTDKEYDKYKKRLLSLEGNGFHVRMVGD